MKSFDDYIDLMMNKDEASFFEVYQQTKAGVYSVIASIIKDRQAIEDLMQETYIKMLKSLNQYQKGRSFTPWLLQIAKNLALDYYRKHQKEVVMDIQENEYLFTKNQVNENQEIDLELNEMLSSLTIDEREVVTLKIVSEMKFKDIAESLNKPLGTVLWIYNKAIKKVKNDLERRKLV
ncbi:MAG: RNA polymerase sigma factor [Erysipelotrichales bacterium]|nr:RNA polymerase sigma factor [Erysipelotrichales bacterium]